MKRYAILPLLALTIVAPAAPRAVRADDSAFYTFFKVPPTPDAVSPVVAYDVNDAGRVAGMAWTSAFGQVIPLGFVWDAASGTRLPVTAPFSSSQIFDVNEGGQIVGYLLASGLSYPFVWDEASGATQLFGPGAFYPLVTRRLALNDAGQIVGTLAETTLTDAYDQSGFYWDATAGPVALPQFRRAAAVNNAGRLVDGVSLAERRPLDTRRSARSGRRRSRLLGRSRHQQPRRHCRHRPDRVDLGGVCPPCRLGAAAAAFAAPAAAGHQRRLCRRGAQRVTDGPVHDDADSGLR
jgi:hypothetical protein